MLIDTNRVVTNYRGDKTFNPTGEIRKVRDDREWFLPIKDYERGANNAVYHPINPNEFVVILKEATPRFSKVTNLIGRKLRLNHWPIAMEIVPFGDGNGRISETEVATYYPMRGTLVRRSLTQINERVAAGDWEVVD